MPVTPIEWQGNILFGTKEGNIYLIDKKFKKEKLLFMGNCRVHTIQPMGDGKFAASNMDGKIIFFKLK